VGLSPFVSREVLGIRNNRATQEMEMRKKRILDHLQTAIGDLFSTLDCDRKRRTQNHFRKEYRIAINKNAAAIRIAADSLRMKAR
jgi:hypothetical protein